MSQIAYYSYNKPCPHCIWIANTPQLSQRFGWKLIDPFDIIPPHGDFIGVTVFDSHKIFKNTFNCVNGVKEGLGVGTNHDFRNIGSLLYGATKFIENLNENFGIKNAHLLINSNFDMKKHGGKEHPHALVTIPDDEEKLIGWKKEEKSRSVSSEPYLDDTVVELSPVHCAELIRSGRDAMKYIAKKFTDKLGYSFNPISDNFYIFLTFICKNNSQPHCGVIHGKISTNLKK
jgi:hypothetical protein